MNIQYFGTGAGLSPIVDTTHFVFQEGERLLYVDAGGGLSLAQRVLKGEIDTPSYLYMTHAHTDHLLGLPHLLRTLKHGSMTIFLSKDLAARVHQLMTIVGKGPWYDKRLAQGTIKLHYIQHNTPMQVFDRTITPIDLYSTKIEQFGLQLRTPTHNIVFFGDEAIDVLQRNDLDQYSNCDRLLCETFCSQAQAAKRDPHPIAHITALEAAQIAQRLQAKNLILSHIAQDMSMDRTTQCQIIHDEASAACDAKVFVPLDGDIIHCN